MKKYILMAAAAVALTGCTNDENLIDEPVAAQISATIGGSAVSRASDISWDKGDAIGVTMGTKYANMKYSTDGDGIFTGTAMYFKNKQEEVTISAYYPFTGTEGSAPQPITVTNTANNQANCDFLYAEPITVVGSNPNVKLNFSHRMSKLTLTFENGAGVDEKTGIKSCTIDGLVLEGTFYPATGDCNASTAPARSINANITGAGTSLIVFPQKVSELKLHITDTENQKYTGTLKFGDDGLVAGNNYQFTVVVSKTQLSVQPSIINWVSAGKLDGNATSDDSDD